MAAAFEAHRSEIFTSLGNEVVLREVVKILVSGTEREDASAGRL
jgi:hypothetical protein